MDTAEIAASAKAFDTRKKTERLGWLIEQIKKKMTEIGQHLKDIRDGKLYEARGFDTFEAFCRDTFGFGNKRANQLIVSDDLRIQLGGEAAGDQDVQAILPKMKEGQLRELGSLPKAKRLEVLREAMKAPSLTAKTIKRAKAVVIDGKTGEPEQPAAKKCPHCGGIL